MASHSSGIPISTQLREKFGAIHSSGSKRLIKVQIIDEQMVPVADMDPSGSWEDDLDRVAEFLEPKEPCYILFRTDERVENGYKWILDCFVPDAAKVRQKMLYASTRASLKLGLGGSFFGYDIFGTVKGDFDKKGFHAYVKMQQSAPPLTESEEIKQMEQEASLSEVSSRSPSQSPQMAHGVAFKSDPSVDAAVKRLVSGGPCYVQITIDEAKELLILYGVPKDITLSQLGDEVPLDRPAFHIFRYDHEFEGTSLKSIVYVYSCPDGSGRTKSAPVKARMVFSSCKGAIDGIVAGAGGSIELRIEINDGKEIPEEFIVHKLHPPPAEKKEAFAKPKPAGKGPKRLIR